MIYQLLEAFITLYSNLRLTYDYTTLTAVFFASYGVIAITLFLLKGIGLYTLSVRNGVDTPWLSFIPFASFYQLGKLIGPMRIFNFRFKNVGVLLAVLCFITTALEVVYDVFAYFDTLQRVLNANSLIAAIDSDGYLIANKQTWLTVIYYFNVVLNLFNIVVFVFAMIAFFRYFAPRSAMLFSILSAIIDPLFSIFVFAVRKNKKGSFYNYGMPYGNPYGNDHGNASNAYRGNGFTATTNDNTSSGENSPFEEYSGVGGVGNADGGSVFEEYAAKPDADKQEQRPDFTDDDDLFS